MRRLDSPLDGVAWRSVSLAPSGGSGRDDAPGPLSSVPGNEMDSGRAGRLVCVRAMPACGACWSLDGLDAQGRRETGDPIQRQAAVGDGTSGGI